jgi:hypothetical protein
MPWMQPRWHGMMVHHFCGAVRVSTGWGEALGYSVAHRRAEAFSTLVSSEIRYSITTRLIHVAGAVCMSAGWGEALGYSVAHRRAEAFNTLVFSEIGYSITTRFIKASTFHPRVLKGNPWCVASNLLLGFAGGDPTGLAWPCHGLCNRGGGTPATHRHAVLLMRFVL